MEIPLRRKPKHSLRMHSYNFEFDQSLHEDSRSYGLPRPKKELRYLRNKSFNYSTYEDLQNSPFPTTAKYENHAARSKSQSRNCEILNPSKIKNLPSILKTTQKSNSRLLLSQVLSQSTQLKMRQNSEKR